MNTLRIFLICPECGSEHWIAREDEEVEGAFECADCGELVFPENMCAKTSRDN